jgi:hypothetical protein
MGGCELNSSDSGCGLEKGFCEHSKEIWGSIGVRDFLSSQVNVSFSGKTLIHRTRFNVIFNWNINKLRLNLSTNIRYSGSDMKKKNVFRIIEPTVNLAKINTVNLLQGAFDF